MKDLFEALGILNENSDIAKLGKKVKQYKRWKIYKGIDDYGDEVFRLFTPDEYRPEIGYEDWEVDTLEQAIDWIDNYDLDECIPNKNAINDIVNLTEEAEQHGTYLYEGLVTRNGKPIGDMKLETEAPSKAKAISNLKFKAAKESGYSSPAGIKIDENKIKFKLKEYLDDNMYPSAEAYKFVLDFVNDAAEYLGYKDNFINNREEYEKAYLYFLDLVEGIKDKKDAGRFLRKLLREKNNKDSFLTKRSIEEIENNMAVNDPAYVDEFQKQVMEIGKKDSIRDKFETSEKNYRDTVRMHENRRNTSSCKNLTESNNSVVDNKPDENGLLIYTGGQVAEAYLDKVKKVIVKDGVTMIDDVAFNGCSNLTTIEIPPSVTSIGRGAFYGCRSLKRVTFADGSQCTSIGEWAFYGCTSLTSVDIPSSVTRIWNSAFEYCRKLTSVDIPSSVTSIMYGAFSDCSSLTRVNIPSSVEDIGPYAFEYSRKLTIHCKKGSYADRYALEYGIPVKYM